MNTTQLQCFTTLASTLNYMRTAEELNMTQPAVSRQIQSLETELGVTLFHRTTRSVSLTQAGAQFLPEASSMLHTYYHSLEWLAGFHTSSQQVLRLGYADTLALRPLAACLEAVTAQQPNLVPEFTLDQTDANLRRLVNGELDVIFGIKDAKFSHPSILFTPLREEYFVCVCAKNHPLAQKKRRSKSVSSEELYPYRQIFDIPPYLLKHVFSRGHRILPVNEDLNNLVCANASEAYAAVLSGLGFALLPKHLQITHQELAFYDWQESPHTPLGIYCAKEAIKDKDSAIGCLLREAVKYYHCD